MQLLEPHIELQPMDRQHTYAVKPIVVLALRTPKPTAACHVVFSSHFAFTLVNPLRIHEHLCKNRTRLIHSPHQPLVTTNNSATKQSTPPTSKMPPPKSTPAPTPPLATPAPSNPTINLHSIAFSLDKTTHRLHTFRGKDFPYRGFARQIEIFRELGPELQYIKGRFTALYAKLATVPVIDVGQAAKLEHLKQAIRQVVRMVDEQQAEFDYWWRGLKGEEREMIEMAHRVALEVRRKQRGEGGGGSGR